MTRTTGTRPGSVDPGRAQARLLRGVLVGLVSGAGAYTAHQVSGGHASPVVGLVVGVLALLAGVAVARWRVRLPLALGLALATQATSHLLLVGSGAHEHLPAHAHHPDRLDRLDHAAGLPMLLAHLGVALLTALVVTGVDRAVLDLLRALVGWFLPRTHALRAPLARTRFAHLIDARLLPRADVVRLPVGRRGPPTASRLSLSPS